MKTRMDELVELINYHNKKYWIDNEPEILDSDYDKLINELKIIEPNNPLLTKILTPQSKVKREKVNHKVPMLSLNKCYSKENLIKWCTSVARSSKEMFLIQPKLDGVSGDFNNGILATRGNGEVGENISSKIPLIKYREANQIKEIKLSDLKKNVRGEIIIADNVFEVYKKKLLKSDGTQYKTARGLCSGLLMKETTDPKYESIIHFINFNVGTTEIDLETMEEINIEDIRNHFKENQSFSTDGFVIKLKDEKYSKLLGFTSHHPKGHIAFKFENPYKETVLMDIEWSVGKHTITPVGLIKPIELNNSTISRISLHNGKFLLDKDLHIGDFITVEKAGEIIPHVKSSRPGKKRTQIRLINCPSCCGQITYNEPEIICNNPDCIGKNSRNLYDSITRIGIENLGLSTVNKLINIGVESLLDIFILTKEDLKVLPGFKEKSIDNLYNEIQKIKEKPIHDWRILSSLNIKGIGQSLSKKLLLENTLDELTQMSIESLTQISNIGEERACELSEGLFVYKQFIDTLKQFFPQMISSKNKQINGKVCFTGKGKHSREYYKQMAERDGYIVCSSVTKDLSFLVTNNMNSNSSSMKKAKANNIKILLYTEIDEN